MRKSWNSVHRMGTQHAKCTMRCAGKLDVVAGKQKASRVRICRQRCVGNEQSQRYMQEMDEVFNQGIPDELHQAVLARTWKIVQEQIEHGSAMNGLKNKIWTASNENRQCISCGIYESDKPEHGGAQRCRDAHHSQIQWSMLQLPLSCD